VNNNRANQSVTIPGLSRIKNSSKKNRTTGAGFPYLNNSDLVTTNKKATNYLSYFDSLYYLTQRPLLPTLIAKLPENTTTDTTGNAAINESWKNNLNENISKTITSCQLDTNDVITSAQNIHLSDDNNSMCSKSSRISSVSSNNSNTSNSSVTSSNKTHRKFIKINKKKHFIDKNLILCNNSAKFTIENLIKKK